MKILLLACLNNTGNALGGAEKTIINLANWLARNTNHEVKLVSVDGDAKPYNINENVNYYGFKLVTGNKIKKHLKLYKYTKKAIKDFMPNVVVSFWIQTIFYATLTKKFSNIDFIFSERNDPNLEYGKIAKLMRRIALKKVSGVVFQTKMAMDYFDNNIKAKSTIIQNPVYIKYYDYKLNEKMDNRIVSVGRLYNQKNQKILIEAFNRIKDKYKDFTLEIYGEGILREELQEQINKNNLNGKVKLMGAHKDVIDKIYGARLFVLPSLYEGMPNALMEAMSLGIPSISSDCPCGGPKELIKNGVNGYLFNNNSIDSLIETMDNALSNNDFNLRKNEKEICNTNSQDVIFKEWEEFINKCNCTKERKK